MIKKLLLRIVDLDQWPKRNKYPSEDFARNIKAPKKLNMYDCIALIWGS
jgi:hypothetical protein